MTALRKQTRGSQKALADGYHLEKWKRRKKRRNYHEESFQEASPMGQPQKNFGGPRLSHIAENTRKKGESEVGKTNFANKRMVPEKLESKCV